MSSPCYPSPTISSVVIQPLSIQDIVHRHDIVVLRHRTTSYSPQFLHVSADSDQQPQVHAERSNVRASFAADPEHGQVALIVEFEEL